MAGRAKFTRIIKVQELRKADVPPGAIATYAALCDHMSNKTNECFPSMARLAEILGYSVRTIQRHLHLLAQKGFILFVERRRYKGRFSSYLYKILFVPTTGHTRPAEKRRSIYRGTRQLRTPPKSPIKQGYEWLFGTPDDPKAEAEHQRKQAKRRVGDSERRKEGYEWLFQ